MKIDKDINNNDLKKNGDVEMPNGRTVYIVFSALIGVGIVSFVLGTIFGVEDIGFYIIRYFVIVAGTILSFFGAIHAATHRKASKTVFGLTLFAIGIILMFLGLLMLFRIILVNIP